MKEVLLGVALAGLAWLGYREYKRSKGKCGCGGKCGAASTVPGATTTTPGTTQAATSILPSGAQAGAASLTSNPALSANGERWNKRRMTNGLVV